MSLVPCVVEVLKEWERRREGSSARTGGCNGGERRVECVLQASSIAPSLR